jgi:hypothetical protein
MQVHPSKGIPSNKQQSLSVSMHDLECPVMHWLLFAHAAI